jgi:hypothetical protein
VHHGDQQTLEIQKKCQERHNAHPQEWFNFYKGWIKCTWAHWHTRPPPASEVRSSKSRTPSLPASERGSFLACAARPVSAPKFLLGCKINTQTRNSCTYHISLSASHIRPHVTIFKILVQWSHDRCSWRKAALKAVLKMQTHFDALMLWLTSPATDLNEDAQLLVPPKSFLVGKSSALRTLLNINDIPCRKVATAVLHRRI